MHNGPKTQKIDQNLLKKGLKNPKFCIDFVSQPSNDLILSIFKCLEILGTLVLESIWMGITKFVIFWQIKAKTEHVLKGIYIFHLQDFVIGIHWKSTNFNKKTVFVELFTFFLFFTIFFNTIIENDDFASLKMLHIPWSMLIFHGLDICFSHEYLK